MALLRPLLPQNRLHCRITPSVISMAEPNRDLSLVLAAWMWSFGEGSCPRLSLLTLSWWTCCHLEVASGYSRRKHSDVPSQNVCSCFIDHRKTHSEAKLEEDREIPSCPPGGSREETGTGAQECPSRFGVCLPEGLPSVNAFALTKHCAFSFLLPKQGSCACQTFNQSPGHFRR
jgi:hypothetical protein